MYSEWTWFFSLQCPEDGSFDCFKSVWHAIIKLRIPAKAKRSSATSRKCRAEYAKVIWIEENWKKIDKLENNDHAKTIYVAWEYVYPDTRDEDRRNECSNWIHFFLTRWEAEQRAK